MAIEGKIVGSGGRVVGRYRADENSIALDVPDVDLRNRFKEGMRRKWPLVVGNTREKGVIGEIYSFKRPTGLSTIAYFNEMIVSMGFVLSDPEEVP